MTDYFRYVGCLLLLVGCHLVNAAEAIKLVVPKPAIVTDHNLWLKTSSNAAPLDFNTLYKAYAAGEVALNLQGGSGGYLSKLHLLNNSDNSHTWFVHLHVNYLDVGLAFWQSDRGELTELSYFGQMDSFAPKLTHAQAFSLELAEQESGTLWIYIQAKKFAVPANIKILSAKDFYHVQYLSNTITDVAISVMLTLALIALFIYLTTGHSVTLACSAYIGLHGVGWLAASGVVGNLFNIDDVNPVYMGMYLFPFAIAAASQFTKLLFDCAHGHLKLQRFFNLFSLTTTGLGIVMLILPFAQSYLISHIIAMFWVPISIATGFYMLKGSDFRARYYLVGNLIYGASLVYYVLSHVLHLNVSLNAELVVILALMIDCFCILLSLSEWLKTKQNEYLASYKLSRTDPLTNIGNRLAFAESVKQSKQVYCITFIDMDGLKLINDQMGHDEGDKLLISCVALIQQQVENRGELFRSGGDEFLWLLEIPNKGLAQDAIAHIIGSLQSVDQALKQQWPNSGISFGVATSLETQSTSQCLSLADQRMYLQKQQKPHNAQRN